MGPPEGCWNHANNLRNISGHCRGFDRAAGRGADCRKTRRVSAVNPLHCGIKINPRRAAMPHPWRLWLAPSAAPVLHLRAVAKRPRLARYVL